eukprot:10572403-Alexandrium_andersonii.AAC.1
MDPMLCLQMPKMCVPQEHECGPTMMLRGLMARDAHGVHAERASEEALFCVHDVQPCFCAAAADAGYPHGG